MARNETTTECDVLIVGAGLVGLTLAGALARGDLDVVVIDRDDPRSALDAGFDGRSSALAHGSSRVLDGIGVWSAIAREAQPILDIRVSDQAPGGRASPLFLHYDHRQVGDDPFGHIVENRVTRRALFDWLPSTDRVRLLGLVELREADRAAAGVVARLTDGTTVRARLMIGADGRASGVRRSAGIRVTQWRYNQAGIVCTVAHEKPHNGVAHEHFRPSGPFAMLPLVDGSDGEHRSSIVWTERLDLTPAMMALDEGAFAAEIARRFGDTLGALRPIGGRWSYPLGLLHAERYVDRRLALAGDAAHAIHPIAGQGFNLGVRDVAALAEVVVDAHRLGLDIGSDTVLGDYQRWRRFDSMAMIAVTDGLNRLFSTDAAPVRWARDLGLAAVQHTPPLKRLFMRHAMGLVGDLPRLVKGEPL